MNFQKNKLIYTKLKRKAIQFNHVCEVGVYLPETSNVIDFIFDGVHTTLVEPDPKNVAAIRNYFNGRTNISLFPVAIYDYNGTVKLSQAAASTFVSELKASPAIVNDKYEISATNTLEVPCKIFSDIDTGDIDLLSIDIEGSEWYVLKNMLSRPKIISIETHGKFYQNPFLPEINNWIAANGYMTWYKDKSDTIFVKQGLFKISFSETIALKQSQLYIGWRRFKKNLYFWK
ncbi:MAG: FkbM family methyltransferase [Verrucomicrobia bacterium]|nr:FkbM family methyltransferase [Cytophagales bacterium]